MTQVAPLLGWLADLRPTTYDLRLIRSLSERSMRFADPLYLLLLVVPAWLGWSRWRARREVPEERIGFSGLDFLAGAPVTRRSRWPWLPEALRLGGLVLLIVALARPQVPHEVRQIRSKSRN